MSYVIAGEEEMLNLGRVLAGCLNGGALITMKGNLGAGKTVFCRGVLRGLGYEGKVKSPTFTLVEPYELNWGQIFHFDLYRLSDPDELEYIGIEDYLQGEHLCLVEWPERGLGSLPRADVSVEIEITGDERIVQCRGETTEGQRICHCLNEAMTRSG